VISYEPLWETMALRNATTYVLQVKGGISSSSIRRIKAGESITLNTLDALCKILECDVSDVIRFKPDPN